MDDTSFLGIISVSVYLKIINKNLYSSDGTSPCMYNAKKTQFSWCTAKHLGSSPLLSSYVDTSGRRFA